METKVPFYHVVNMLLLGLVLMGGVLIIFYQQITTLSFVKKIFLERIGIDTITIFIFLGIIYESGLIINRISSVFVEWILKKAKIVPFNNNYALFNQRKKVYPIMDTLSREYALARGHMTMFLILAICSVINLKWLYFLICLLLCIVFILSARKHCKRIVELME